MLQGEVFLAFPKEVWSVTGQVLYDESCSDLFLLWSGKGGLVLKSIWVLATVKLLGDL